MKRILLISAGAIVAILAVLVYVGFNRMKTISPEKTSFYEKDGLKIKVTYNSPSKREEKFLGALCRMERFGEREQMSQLFSRRMKKLRFKAKNCRKALIRFGPFPIRMRGK